MRHLKTFSLFESVQILVQDQQDFLTKHTKGSWSINSSTGLVDVRGDFNCAREGLKDFLGIRFGAVSGNFYCDSNELTSLEGAPQTVGGDFSCYNNALTSLEGAPRTVGGNFYCHNNKLTSLEGAPQTVGGGFYCSQNELTSLEGAPRTVGEEFYCDHNALTSLEGAPRTVGEKFYSDDLEIPEGEWGIETFVDLLKTGTSKEKKIVATLIDPKVLQQQIDQNPEGMLVKLKDVLKHPKLQGLKWPKHLDQEKDLLSDLSIIGQ